MKSKKSPLKGQGTLFSFFNKKEPKKEGNQNRPANPETPPSSSPHPTVAQATEGITPKSPERNLQELVGKRVRVFWPDDQEWFVGSVMEYSSLDGKHTIHYNDGDRERVVLANEKFEILDLQEESGPGRSRNRYKMIRDDEEEWNQDQLDTDSSDDSPLKGVDDSNEVKADNGSHTEDLGTQATKKTQTKIKTYRDMEKISPSTSDGPISKRQKKVHGELKCVGAETVATGSFSASELSYFQGGAPNVSATPRRGKSSKCTSGLMSDTSQSSAVPKTRVQLPEGVLETGRHTHHGLAWLNKDRMDKERRRPDDPGYNPRTLHVPASFLKGETPAMQQWWSFKSENMDTVLFFKVGKFYELFHQDADVGMQELDLIYMKGEKAHSGFPEISYGKFAHILVSRGYRVARVEQVETPEMLKMRNASASKSSKDKVVRRELCSILSRGTRTYCYLDDVSSPPDGSPRSVDMILSIKENASMSRNDRVIDGDRGDADIQVAACEYGICMVDCTTATFCLGQFADDQARSRLRTLLAQQPPAEILLEKDSFSETTVHMVKCMAPSGSHIVLQKDEFWNHSRTLKELQDGKYFGAGKASKGHANESIKDAGKWPEILGAVIEGGNDGALALSALGAIIWHTRRALIDHDLLSMRRFVAYIPSDIQHSTLVSSTQESAKVADINLGEPDAADLPSASSLPGSSSSTSPTPHMVLDGVSLSNLEVMRNSYDGGEKGSLWGFINRCSTAFGRRLLKDWLLKPLVIPRYIEARLDAVLELSNSLSPEADSSRNLLKRLPDIERLLSRVHSMASKHRGSEHPESRAIMYEDTKYSVRKVSDFLSILDGLEVARGIPELYAQANVTAPLLRKCVLPVGGGGCFPDTTPVIAFFRTAFDAGLAKKDGVIKPKPGVDVLFDEAKHRITCIESELKDYLQEQRQRLKCSEISFWGTAKDKYQLEVPEGVLSKNGQPPDYELKSRKKGWKRFWTPLIRRKLQDLSDSEQRLGEAQRDQMRRLFAKFDEHRDLWASAVRCLAHVDALLSLAEISGQPGFSRPRLYREDVATFLRLKNARHPCLAQTYQGGEYIPNDTSLGVSPKEFVDDGRNAPNMLLLTGPNMGGKSTLLRQTCLVVILAQIGCFVPADEAHLTPFDRIFTRVGASDRILAGQSTFFVELNETANILHHATSRSLVILDELGRGTSTFDGTAIAHAVAHDLVKRSRCLALFATHYHSLVEEWGRHDEVALGHMSCLVDDSGGEQRVTFLYKLVPGPCPKSFGINVARLAELPPEVIYAAKMKSEEFESTLARKDASTTGDGESRLALTLLAVLGSVEGTTEVGQKLHNIWVEARK